MADFRPCNRQMGSIVHRLWSISGYVHEDFLDLLGRQRELNFKPGDQHLYSNSGYLLLAIFVEGVSDKSLREFTVQNIFRPLGMEHTFFRDDPTAIVPNRATGYSFENASFKFHATNFARPGSGGLLTPKLFLR